MPAPTAKTASVVDGESDTTRSGGPAFGGGPVGAASGGPGGRGGGLGFGFGGPGGGGGGQAMTFAGPQWDQLDAGLVQYLEANQGSATYLVATPSSSYASLFVLASHQPALALGGYQGWDRILDPSGLAALVQRGVVRYFYLPTSAGRGGPAASLDATSDLASWVQSTCTPVAASTWQTSASSPRTSAAEQLYDCG